MALPWIRAPKCRARPICRTDAARIAGGVLGGEPLTLLRVEGFGPSVAYRIATLEGSARKGRAGSRRSPSRASRAVWRDIRDCMPFADGSERPVWRVSMAPSQGHRMVLALRMEAAVDAFYDWQGGLIWLRIEGEPEAEPCRRAGRARMAAAMRRWCARRPAERAAVPVFEPQPAALAALSARLKAQFDPKAILNPGRMTPDADQLHPCPARRPACRGIGEDPAQMRALRLLHRDLPDLCDARQRARSARAGAST